MNITKKTKIIGTIGPASETKEVIKKLYDAGLNVARLNFSHGDHQTHLEKIKIINELINEGCNMAIMLDTKGPEIRTGDFENNLAVFNRGDVTRISMKPVLGTKEKFSVTYKELINDVKIGDEIKFDDGRLELEIIEIDHENEEIVCKVLNNHSIKSRRNCVAPFARLSMPFISEKDYEDIKFGCINKVDFIAASFTRRKEDILDIRKILKEYDAEDIKIIAKIENQEGVDNLEDILSVADGAMVARGDLGVEIAPEEVPLVQKQIVNSCLRLNKIVIVATHMLDSMQKNPTPTRAEVSDVSNAVFEMCDSIMLSGESASGDFPVESVLMESKIASRMESVIDYHRIAEKAFKYNEKSTNDAIAYSVANTVLLTDAKLIIAFSRSGATSRRISSYRPKCPIISVSSIASVVRKLCLTWGVYGFYCPSINRSMEEFENKANDIAKVYGVKPGEQVVITGGDGFGSTNFMKIVTVK